MGVLAFGEADETKGGAGARSAKAEAAVARGPIAIKAEEIGRVRPRPT